MLVYKIRQSFGLKHYELKKKMTRFAFSLLATLEEIPIAVTVKCLFIVKIKVDNGGHGVGSFHGHK